MNNNLRKKGKNKNNPYYYYYTNNNNMVGKNTKCIGETSPLSSKQLIIKKSPCLNLNQINFEFVIWGVVVFGLIRLFV